MTGRALMTTVVGLTVAFWILFGTFVWLVIA